MPDLPAIRPEQLGPATAKPDSPSPSHGTEGSKGSLRMCVLSLGGELFAIDLRNIREVFEVESVTAVPGMPSMLPVSPIYEEPSFHCSICVRA